MGTKVIQYMVHRRPVISTGGWYDQYGEFLKNGINCLLVRPDPVRLGEVIVQVLNDERLRESLGEEAWKTVQPYTWDKHAEVTESELVAAVKSRI
jgi:glycosyltransferase involved in cell wall biosynthesis